jgi:3-oxoacyl-[acyl-carrier protein] reductase
MKRLTSLSRSIQGKVALVTGAASGMGRATALLFADEGARLALVDINEQGLDEVAATIRAAGGEVLVLAADCSQREAVQNTVVRAAEHYDGIDILINNAGIVLGSDINNSEEFEASWEQSLAVMASAQQWAIRAALPWLRRAEHPRILNVASTEALGATAHNAAYVVAKAAGFVTGAAVPVDGGLTIRNA